MPLQPGQSLSHYSLAEKLGEGGMGVVYRAEDTSLKRPVALKFLTEQSLTREDRRARFLREARLAAALNHPSICTIHAVGEIQPGEEQALPAGEKLKPGTPFIAMELIEGHTLAERLRPRKTLPLDDLLQISLQVVEALAAAHARDIVHRDLKPGNVMLTTDGRAKILDFGLAKPLGPTDPEDEAISRAQTLSDELTREGMVVGTAAYMSPEQAQGMPLDSRSDIFSFGIMLYEMVTGERPFQGDSAESTRLKIIESEPRPFELDDVAVPYDLERITLRCLRKDPADRYNDTRDLVAALKDARNDTSGASRARSRSGTGEAVERRTPRTVLSPGTWISVVGALAVLLVFAGWFLDLPKRLQGLGDGSANLPSKFSIVVPEDQTSPSSPVISPDGRTIAYHAWAKNPDTLKGERRVYMRKIGDFSGEIVEKSHGSSGALAFSADSRWLAFVGRERSDSDEVKLIKVALDGSGPPLVLADWPEDVAFHFFTWLPGGDIVTITKAGDTLVRFDPEARREPVRQSTAMEGVKCPCLMGTPFPDGTRVTLVRMAEEEDHETDIAVLDTVSGEGKLLLKNGGIPRVTSTGHLVFTRGETIHAAALDLATGELRGGPVPLLAGLRTHVLSNGRFSVSGNGTLVFRPGGIVSGQRQLVWIDESGGVAPWSSDRQFFQLPLWIDRTEEKIAVLVTDLGTRSSEIWVSELGTPDLRRFVAERKRDCGFPVWSPDGNDLYYTCEDSSGEGGIYRRSLDGSNPPAEIMTWEGGKGHYHMWSIAPDGTALALQLHDHPSYVSQYLDLSPGAERRPQPFITDQPNVNGVTYSNDGRWIAYASDESGAGEIYVRRIDGIRTLSAPVRVTDGGGAFPIIWRSIPDSDLVQVIYLGTDINTWRVTLDLGTTVKVTNQEQVTDSTLDSIRGPATPLRDGRWLAIKYGPKENDDREFRIVQNWFTELQEKMDPSR